MIDHGVVIRRLPTASLPQAARLGMGAEVHVRGVEPAEEGGSCLVLLSNPLLCRRYELIVTRLHALLGERPRILDRLPAHAAPAWMIGRIIFFCRPAMQNSTRGKLLVEGGEILF